MCAGYPAGTTRGAPYDQSQQRDRALISRSATAIEGDLPFYPDDDLMWIDDEDGGYYAHKDGQRYG